MQNSFVVLTVACLLSGQPETTLAAPSTVEHYLTVDVSGSNPYMHSETQFARRAYGEAASNLRKYLRRGDRLTLTSIGESAAGEVIWSQFKIKKPSDFIAGTLLRRLKEIATGGVPPQGTTKIRGFFARTDFACTPERSLVVVITDGRPTAEPEADGEKLLNGDPDAIKPLPAGSLEGCTVLFIGIGAERDQSRALTDTQHANLRQGWRTAIEAAGGIYREAITR